MTDVVEQAEEGYVPRLMFAKKAFLDHSGTKAGRFTVYPQRVLESVMRSAREDANSGGKLADMEQALESRMADDRHDPANIDRLVRRNADVFLVVPRCHASTVA